MLSNTALAQEQKENKPDLRPLDFFKGELSGRLLIDADNLCKCLAYHGWHRHNGLYARIGGKTLFQGDRGDLIRHLSKVLNKEDGDFTHAVMKNLMQLTTPTALELLPELKVDILRDDKDHIRLPYLNGILSISKDGLNLLPYSDMDCYKADLSEKSIFEAVEPLIDFRERFNEETKSRVKNAFTKILRKWAVIREVDLKINQERYLSKSQKVIRMHWLQF